ncbi:hypothetical protein RD149_21920, partial [Gordonia westfalica]|nr:hypothetical protein [Gordonia westfalica]
STTRTPQSPSPKPHRGVLHDSGGTTLFVGKDYGFDEVIHTPDLVDRVRKDWRATKPLVEWIAAHSAT